MFDKKVDITKVYGSKVIKHVPRSSFMRKASTGYKKKKISNTVTVTQLRQIYALQKSLGITPTWNTMMSYNKALLLIENLRFKEREIKNEPKTR